MTTPVSPTSDDSRAKGAPIFSDEATIAKAVSNALNEDRRRTTYHSDPTTVIRDEIKALRDDVIEIHSATETLMSVLQRKERGLHRLHKLGGAFTWLSVLGLLLCQTCMMLRRP